MAEKTKKINVLNANINMGGVSTNDKIFFAKHLAIMLRAGLTISEALDIVQHQAKGKIKSIISNIAHLVDSGNSLSKAMSKYPNVFSTFFVNTIYVGESSGTLDQNLENVANQLHKDKELAEKIKSAMLYPLIVLGLAGGLGSAIAFFVLPKITPLFEGLGMDLPFSTKVLIWVSKLIEAHGLKLAVSVIGSLIVLVVLVRQKFSQPITHWLLLHIPIIRDITRNRNVNAFCLTLGTLLKSGLNIDESINIAKDTVNNYYYRRVLTKVAVNVSHGSSLSDNLNYNRKYFPELVVGMIKVGERSGKFEETLFYLANYYEEEVNLATKNLSTAIEPILLIFIGLAVGGLAMSIITPIYKITGGVNK